MKWRQVRSPRPSSDVKRPPSAGSGRMLTGRRSQDPAKFGLESILDRPDGGVEVIGMKCYKLAVVVLLLSSGAWADRDDDARRGMLKGIRGYEVVAGRVDNFGFSADDVRTMTEL